MPTTFVRIAAVLLAIAGTLTASRAWAWGATGHRMIGRAAIEALPDEIPAFLRTERSVLAIGELAREPDRSRGAGSPHDPDLDPAHFVDVDDQGRINGGPLLSALPPTREGYEAALRALNTDGFKSGYLPYAIAEGYEQLVIDFRYWRVETAALKTAKTPEDATLITHDRTLREWLIMRDLGVWAHFVGDGSQPMHVSVHYNGWGDFPNPNAYTNDKIHAPFEGPFVRDHVTLAGVKAAMTPYAPCAPVATCTARFLAATAGEVEPLYRLWGSGVFQTVDPRAIAFTTERVAAGADALRNMVVDAWRESAGGEIGYPKFSVKDAEDGQPVPLTVLFGAD